MKKKLKDFEHIVRVLNIFRDSAIHSSIKSYIEVIAKELEEILQNKKMYTRGIDLKKSKESYVIDGIVLVYDINVLDVFYKYIKYGNTAYIEINGIWSIEC